MAHFEFSSVIPKPKEKVFKFMADFNNLQFLFPSDFKVEFESPIEPLAKGKEFCFRMGRFGVSVFWETVIEDFSPNDYFRDRQKSGPFALWIHTHKFEDHHEGTLMTDIIEYELPFGLLGKLGEDLILARELRKLFEYRTHFLTKEAKI